MLDLKLAMAEGDQIAVTEFIEQNLNNLFTEPLLFLAIDHNQPQMIKLLSKAGLTSILTFDHEDIFYYTFKKGRAECLRELFEHFELTSFDPNPLAIACKSLDSNGDYETTLMILLDKCPYLMEIEDHFKSPLEIAVQHKNLELVRILCLRGAKIDEDDGSFFEYVFTSKDKELIDLILQQQCDPAHLAAEYGYLEYFKQHDCLELLNDNGETILHSAVYGNQESLVKWLISQGMDVNRRNGGGETPVHYAMELDQSGILEMLLCAGGNLNLHDNEGNPPLCNLTIDQCLFGCIDNHVKLAVEYGADLSLINKDGITVKQWLMEYGSEEIRNYINESEKYQDFMKCHED